MVIGHAPITKQARIAPSPWVVANFASSAIFHRNPNNKSHRGGVACLPMLFFDLLALFLITFDEICCFYYFCLFCLLSWFLIAFADFCTRLSQDG